MKLAVRSAIAVFSLYVTCTAVLAQPHVVNAQFSTRSADAGLEREMHSLMASQSGPAWVGYSVPVIEGDHRMCCWDSTQCCGNCSLEGRNSERGVSISSSPVNLESGGLMFVLARIEAGAVQQIRMFSPGCELDAGGLPFYWITGVRPADSIAWLSSYATRQEEQHGHHLSDSAVAAIAFHRNPEADGALESFVAPTQPAALRERTAFWLGNARGRRGYQVLQGMLRNDPSEQVRDKVVFALTQSKEPEALDTLIETARGDKSAHVRGQALFWLSQKAGKKAEAAITAAIENDPETEIKKKAVFALSQLPKDEGVPLLIQVAKENKNPAVRKQAMFWLGQSKDPRALAFFEQILKN